MGRGMMFLTYHALTLLLSAANHWSGGREIPVDSMRARTSSGSGQNKCSLPMAAEAVTIWPGTRVYLAIVGTV